jgi:predicted nucleic acid-binding protein
VIAADTSALIGYLKDDPDPRIERLHAALARQLLWLPPPVLTELRAGRVQNAGLDRLLKDAPVLPLEDGFWDRAGETRRTLLLKGVRARTLDALIAQCCIDANAPLLTLDSDFRHFETHCGLKLA